MVGYLSIGEKLFHKYLGDMTVTNINENCIKAYSSARGVLDFAFYDFGKVIFLKKDHSGKLYKTFEEYVEFHEEEKRIKIELNKQIELEQERKRIRQIEGNLLSEKYEIENQYKIDMLHKELLNKRKNLDISPAPLIEKINMSLM